MTGHEVGCLVRHLPLERRLWLLDSIDLEKQLAWLRGYHYDKPLCSYVEARLLGKHPSIPLTHCVRRNGKVIKYRLAA